MPRRKPSIDQTRFAIVPVCPGRWGNTLCDRTDIVKASGYCSTHHDRLRMNRKLDAPMNKKMQEYSRMRKGLENANPGS